jgi:DNA repair protein RadC
MNFIPGTGNKSLYRIRATSINFNIVNEIKVSYPRKGNSEKFVGNSKDALEVFRQHFDHDEMDYRESFLPCI